MSRWNLSFLCLYVFVPVVSVPIDDERTSKRVCEGMDDAPAALLRKDVKIQSLKNDRVIYMLVYGYSCTRSS